MNIKYITLLLLSGVGISASLRELVPDAEWYVRLLVALPLMLFLAKPKKKKEKSPIEDIKNKVSKLNIQRGDIILIKNSNISPESIQKLMNYLEPMGVTGIAMVEEKSDLLTLKDSDLESLGLKRIINA